MTQGLRSRIFEVMAGAATRGPYALVDYPNYLNPGDAAIWLGARHLLERLNGGPPAYSPTLRRFSPEDCRAAIGDGTIYFLGGGNFGDLYARHQQKRLAVLHAMPANPIVHLPLSCAWADTRDSELIRQTEEAHRDRRALTVFARDHKAQAELRERCGIESELCPDLSHLVEITAPAASKSVVRLMRRDVERKNPDNQPAPSSIDWRATLAQRLANRFGKLALPLVPQRLLLQMQDRVAQFKVDRAAETIGSGASVETDRLHAALFAAALGRRVTLYDNSTGKVHAYHDAWKDLLPDVFDLAEDRLIQPGRVQLTAPAIHGAALGSL